MIIKAGKIIVGKELEVKENAAIKIENGKITEIYDKSYQCYTIYLSFYES